MSRGIIASLLLHALVLVPLLIMFAPQLDAPAGRESMQTRFIAQTVNIEALRPEPVLIQPEAPPETETLTPLTSESEQATTVTPVQPETVEPNPRPEPEIAEAVESPLEPEQKSLLKPEEIAQPKQVAQLESEPVESEPQSEPELVEPRVEPEQTVRAAPLPEPPPEQTSAREETPSAEPQPPAPQEHVAAVHDAPPAGASSPSATSDAPAEGGGGTTPDPSYLMEIRALLEAHKTYPAMAQRRGMEGDVHLWFVINRQGRVLDYRISKGSGYEMLDEEVERLIQAISQFPPVPSEVDSDQLELIVPVSFRLAG